MGVWEGMSERGARGTEEYTDYDRAQVEGCMRYASISLYGFAWFRVVVHILNFSSVIPIRHTSFISRGSFSSTYRPRRVGHV